MNKDGWSDSFLGRSNSAIHYYKDGVSLCGRSELNDSSFGFDKSTKTMGDAYSHHCKLCIKKQLKQT